MYVNKFKRFDIHRLLFASETCICKYVPYKMLLLRFSAMFGSHPCIK